MNLQEMDFQLTKARKTLFQMRRFAKTLNEEQRKELTKLWSSLDDRIWVLNQMLENEKYKDMPDEEGEEIIDEGTACFYTDEIEDRW